MNGHKPFPICGCAFQNELGFQKDGNSFGLGSPNRGGERPAGWGIQRGQRSRLPARSVLQSVCDTLRSPLATRTPWQWFPKAAVLPWREESKGGQHTAAGHAEFGFNQYVSTSGKSTPIGCAFLIDMAFETGLEQF